MEVGRHGLECQACLPLTMSNPEVEVEGLAGHDPGEGHDPPTPRPGM